jgi:pyruvate/2-oxoglutarate dehydrogenase complex dihydrolipoamide dehydrogenase (E3) component
LTLKSDRILGFTVLGVEGSEMMAAVQTAMVGGLPYTVLTFLTIGLGSGR